MFDFEELEFEEEDEDEELESEDDDEPDDEVEFVLALLNEVEGKPPQPTSIAAARMTKQVFTRNSPAFELEVRQSAEHMQAHAGKTSTYF